MRLLLELETSGCSHTMCKLGDGCGCVRKGSYVRRLTLVSGEQVAWAKYDHHTVYIQND
jgi:hypothetical protein